MTKFVDMSVEPQKPSANQLLEVMDRARHPMVKDKPLKISADELVWACLSGCMAKLKAEHEDAGLQAALDADAPPWLYRELQRVCTFMKVP